MGVVLLVRHGQASWGAADYDVLSARGEEQAAVLGTALAGRNVVPELVLHGAMVRQRRTAELAAAAAGWSTPVERDRDWDEMDHVEVLSRVPAPFQGRDPAPAEFQAWFEQATERWSGGRYDAEYTESFAAFTGRVGAALDRVADRAGPDGTAVVFTSGGPIAWAVAHLTAAGAETYRRVAPVVVNASVTKVVLGRRGATLVSFNEHAHLEPDLVSYR